MGLLVSIILIMKENINIEQVKKIAVDLHRKICSHSKSLKISQSASLVFNESNKVYMREISGNTQWEISVIASLIRLYKNGRFGTYENSVRMSEQSKGIGRDRTYIIRNREQATQWVNLYKQYFKSPSNANFRLDFYGEKMSPDRESLAGAIYAYWEYPPPTGYKLYWDMLLGREKHYMGAPQLYVNIDPLDGTLVEAGDSWSTAKYRPPVVKITQEQALAIARIVAPQELKMRINSGARMVGQKRIIPSLGTPRAELCYKIPLRQRHYMKSGKLVFEQKPFVREVGDSIREFILVWNVRFGGYIPNKYPHFVAEVNIDAETGEVVDNGR
jgi:hypothetical protein